MQNLDEQRAKVAFLRRCMYPFAMGGLKQPGQFLLSDAPEEP
jgi:hypothetical protein